MDNTITIGQQHYHWQIETYRWLGLMECTITNIIDANEQLVVIVEGNSPEVYNPQNIRLWISFALYREWYSSRRIYQVQKESVQLKIDLLPHSLAEQAVLTKEIAQRFGYTVEALVCSHLHDAFEQLHQKLKFRISSALRQLYFSMGNGGFGPDYGFLKIYSDQSSKQATIWEMYQNLHDGSIKDWNWTLPETLVPFLDWGNNIYSLIDCSSPHFGIWVLDENLKKKDNKWQDCLWRHTHNCLDWLTKWNKNNDESGREIWLEMYRIKGLVD